MESYLALLQQMAGLQADLRTAVLAPQHCLPFLQPGRLVRVLQVRAGGLGDQHTLNPPHRLGPFSHARLGPSRQGASTPVLLPPCVPVCSTTMHVTMTGS